MQTFPVKLDMPYRKSPHMGRPAPSVPAQNQMAAQQ